jgi:hypothetical protein
MSTRTFWGSQLSPTRRRGTRRSACWSCGELCHFKGNCPYGRETENDDQRWKHGDRPLRDKQEPPRKSEWQPSSNWEAYRRDGQPSGNKGGPAKKGRRRCIH